MTTKTANTGSAGGTDAPTQGAELANEYQPPTLTPLGNARDLLAGANGSVPDTQPPMFRVTKPGP